MTIFVFMLKQAKEKTEKKMKTKNEKRQRK